MSVLHKFPDTPTRGHALTIARKPLYTIQSAHAQSINALHVSTRHYSKAPIIEAVIDIQIAPQSETVLACLKELVDTLKDRFPSQNKLNSVRMHVEHNAEDAAKNKSTTTLDEIGFRLVDEPNTRVLQLKKTGFTFSHLPPYSDWDSFSTDAKEYWELFVKCCEPGFAARTAVRYINRIDIPIETVEIEDYLNLYPKIPEGIPQTIQGMHLQLQMPQTDIASMAVINEAVVEPAIAKGLSIIVDIDVFNSSTTALPDIWNLLEQLRTRKNVLFESIITDKTRELIQ